MGIQNRLIWTTDDEILYLKEIGTFRSGAKRQMKPAEKIRLLEKYRESMKSRTGWGKLDPVMLGSAIDLMILDLTVESAKAEPKS